MSEPSEFTPIPVDLAEVPKYLQATTTRIAGSKRQVRHAQRAEKIARGEQDVRENASLEDDSDLRRCIKMLWLVD